MKSIIATGKKSGSQLVLTDNPEIRINNVLEDYEIVITLEKMKFNVTLDIGKGGIASPDKGIKVEYNDNSPEYVFKADEGYRIKDVLVNGISQGAIDSIQLNGIKEDKLIQVVFEKIPAPDPVEPTDPVKPTEPTKPADPVEKPISPNDKNGAVTTHDESRVELNLWALLLSGFGLLFIIRKSFINKSHQDK